MIDLALRPRVGISSCLLGMPVRYNGGDKRDDWIVDQLGRFVEFRPVCPEMEMGLGTPRESVRLVAAHGQAPRMLGNDSNRDWTSQAAGAAARVLSELGREAPLDGYIFKKSSPSCGVERVKVFTEGGMPLRPGRGLFAEALIAARPRLPVTEEGRLSEVQHREQFVTRIFAHARLRALEPELAALQRFHQAYKLVLMAHSPRHCQELGRLVGQAAGPLAPEALHCAYSEVFLDALAVPSSVGKRVNVLQHALGYFKARLDRSERREILAVIEDYGRGELPLTAPLSLLRHFARKFSVAYLEGQYLFAPYPKELALRRYL